MKSLAAVIPTIILISTLLQAEEHPKPVFEVASVKLNTSVGTSMSINNAPSGQLTCTNASLRMLVTFAYNIRDHQLINMPDWATSVHYDIVAKPSPEDAPFQPKERSDEAIDLLRRRTRALLAERFGLVAHDDTRETTIYVLVVAKGGPKLKPTETENGPQISTNDRTIICKKVTMKRFAEVAIAGKLRRTVEDHTGLTGEYDLKVEFAPDASANPDANRTASNDVAGPDFLTALREQLGLRLDTAKGAEKVLVIDKVERATEN